MDRQRTENSHKPQALALSDGIEGLRLNALKLTTVTAIGIGALTGCASSVEATPPRPTTSTSAEATPSQSPEATATPDPTTPEDVTLIPGVNRFEGSDFVNTEPLPAHLEYLETTSDLSIFAAAPKNEQLEWAAWAEQYKEEFVQYFRSISGLETDDPYILEPNSDVETLMREIQVIHRIAANFGTGNPTTYDDNGALDSVRAAKLLTAHSVVSDFNYAAGITVKKIEEETMGLSINSSYQGLIGYADILYEAKEAPDFESTPRNMRLPFNGSEIPGFLYSFTNSEGELERSLVAPYTYTNSEGEQVTTVLESRIELF